MNAIDLIESIWFYGCGGRKRRIYTEFEIESEKDTSVKMPSQFENIVVVYVFKF